MDSIKENDYNLNISRYVSTAEPEKPIDLNAVHQELAKLEDEKELKKHNAFLKELGLAELS